MMTNMFLSILGISVSISLVVAVLILLAPFLNKRYVAKWNYLIWIFLALRLLLPFSGANGQPLFDMLPQRKTQAVSEFGEKHTGTPVGVTTSPRRVMVEIPAQMTTPIALQPEKSNVSLTWLDIMAFVWMMGSLIFLSVHFISYLHYKRQVMKKGTRIEDTHILQQISELKQELHVKCTIQAIEYAEAGSPMILGFLKPILVLPKEQYSPEELYFILKHELVHLKRGDTYFKLLFVAANAVHWFNPLIWMMQKEAIVDMELSCDERVTQGTDYAVRKAYTETLLSMLHKQCAKRTVLSTQFYGGKEIMKRRFKNILIKRSKKNGISILICAVILTIGLGTRVGYSIAKTGAGEVGEIGEIFGQFGKEAIQLKQVSAKNHPAGNQESANQAATLENTTILTFSKEGEMEQKQATLATGDGYALYLPDGEWQQSDSALWTAAANEQVRLWITHFEDTSLKEIKEELDGNGYGLENHEMMKQEGEMIYKVRLHAFGNDVWGVFYCYPTEAEEGWGRELPVIADTFAVST